MGARLTTPETPTWRRVRSRMSAALVAVSITIAGVAVGAGPAVAANPNPKPDPLTATVELPGPLVGGGQNETLPIVVTAGTKGKGSAFIGMPATQPSPGVGQPIHLGIGDGVIQPQVQNSGLSGYVSVSPGTCTRASLVATTPIGTTAQAGIEVAYDCAAGQTFLVAYSPRIHYWDFDPAFGAQLDTWSFSLSQRVGNAKWRLLASTPHFEVGPVIIQQPNLLYTAPPAPLVAVEDLTANLVLTLQGYNDDGTKILSLLSGTGTYIGIDDGAEIIYQGSADNLRSIQQLPLQVNGCIWDSPPGSDLSVTGTAFGPQLLVFANAGSDHFDTSSGHDLADGDVVVFAATQGGNVTIGTKYHVINAGSDTFQLATTAGSTTAVDLTSDFVGNVKQAVNTISASSHGLTNGDAIIVTEKTGGSNVTLDTRYRVINATGNAFQISADGVTPLDLGSDLLAPTTIRQQHVSLSGTLPPGATVDASLICENVNTFGSVTLNAPSGVFTKSGEPYEGFVLMYLAGVIVSTNGWIGPARDCSAAGGSFVATDGLTPGGQGPADWRCDFAASKGMTTTSLEQLIAGWRSTNGEVATCATKVVYIEENWAGGNGADDVWCRLATV